MQQQDIRKPLDNSKRVPAPDCNRQRVQASAMVEIVDGPHKGKAGKVVHVAKPHIWVHSQQVMQVRTAPLSTCGFLTVVSDEA